MGSVESARRGWEIGGSGVAQNVGVVGCIYFDPRAEIDHGAANECGVHKAGTGRIQLGDESVVFAISYRAKRAGRDREIAGAGFARDVRVTARIHGDAERIVYVRGTAEKG